MSQLKTNTLAKRKKNDSESTATPIRRGDQRLLKQLCDHDRRGLMDELGVIIEEAARKRGLIPDESSIASNSSSDPCTGL